MQMRYTYYSTGAEPVTDALARTPNRRARPAFRRPLAALLLAGLVGLAPGLAGIQGSVAHAASGFIRTNPWLQLVIGEDSGNVSLATTSFLPSVNVAGTPNPTVNWGDGTIDSLNIDNNSYDAGSPCYQGQSGPGLASAGVFCELDDHHIYKAAGTYTITTTYYTGALVSYSTTTMASVIVPTLVYPTFTNLYPTPNALWSGTVATFIDDNVTDPASTFQASINWGDGSAQSAGSVTGAYGYFSVSGSHTYAAAGTYAVDVKTSYGNSTVDVYSAAHVVTPATYEVNNTDPGITYIGSSWAYSGNRGFGDYYDDEQYTTANGDFLTYTFSGTGINVIGERNAVDGSAEVYLDGVDEGSVSTVAATRQVQQSLYSISGLVNGSHTLKVVKTSGEYLEVDALSARTTGTTINDTAPGIVYKGSGWYYSSGRSFVPGLGDYQGDVHATTQNGNIFGYTFTGTGISYITETGSYYGHAAVYLDGNPVQAITSYTSAGANVPRQVVYSISGLPAGQHTLKVVKTDGTWMLLDALTVQS
jgi:hypothetical protein